MQSGVRVPSDFRMVHRNPDSFCRHRRARSDAAGGSSGVAKGWAPALTARYDDLPAEAGSHMGSEHARIPRLWRHAPALTAHTITKNDARLHRFAAQIRDDLRNQLY